MPEGHLPETTSGSSPAGVPAAQAVPRGKKKTFADTFLLNFSLIEAAKAAGAEPGKEQVLAEKMMADSKVAIYIARKIAETPTDLRPSQLRVMDEMSAVMFARPELEFHTDGDKAGQLKAVRLDKMDLRAIQQFSVRQHKDGTDITVKMHPKVEMLKTAGQINGLVNEEGAPPRRVTMIFNGPTQVNQGGGRP